MKKREAKLEDVLFFAMDQTVKKTKSYSQQRFDAVGMNITVDQWVLLKILEVNDGITQVELARLAAKDTASITRMLDLLEKNKLIRRTAHPEDRRKYILLLTKEGHSFIKKYMPLVNELRKQGVKGITKSDVETVHRVLKTIMDNMK